MRLRALRKKYNRILQMEESFAAGKTLNREQEEVLRSKPVVSALIDELERLRAPLSSALAEELSSRPATPARDASSSSSDSDSSIQDINGSGRDLNGAPPCGQVRVLVVGDSGVGKSSLVHLILKGSAIARPAQTIGCTVDVKHITYGSPGSSSNCIKGDAERNFFVELWDVSGHERYKECRSQFYSQINGVIFVYDLSQRKTKTNLNKWAVEVAQSGTFSAPLGSGGPGGLPVPYLVIANKVDIAPRDGRRVSSGNLVDVARQWVEKQGLLPSSEELPLAESFPGNSGLLMSAKEARYDKEALVKFFRVLIRRRYFSNELPAPSPWSLTPRDDTILPVENVNDDVLFQRKSYGGQSYKYNGVAPLPAQRNLTPPPTLYPQQPMSSSSENYRYHRFSSSAIPDASSGRTSRADINI